jgi:hypothetical protein
MVGPLGLHEAMSVIRPSIFILGLEIRSGWPYKYYRQRPPGTLGGDDAQNRYVQRPHSTQFFGATTSNSAKPTTYRTCRPISDPVRCRNADVTGLPGKVRIERRAAGRNTDPATHELHPPRQQICPPTAHQTRAHPPAHARTHARTRRAVVLLSRREVMGEIAWQS